MSKPYARKSFDTISFFLLILLKAIEILSEESNVQPVQAPVTICGKCYGFFDNLLEIFRVAGRVPVNHSDYESNVNRILVICLWDQLWIKADIRSRL